MEPVQEDTGDRGACDKDERVEEVVGAVFHEELGEVGSTQLKVGHSLMQAQRASGGTAQQHLLVGAARTAAEIVVSNTHIYLE